MAVYKTNIGAYQTDVAGATYKTNIGADQTDEAGAETHQITSTAAITLTATSAAIQTYQTTATAAIVLSASAAVLQDHKITATAAIVLTASGALRSAYQVTSTAAIALSASGAVKAIRFTKLALLDRTLIGSILLRVGTAAAGTAPLKFTAGTNLAVPEPGAVEYDGDRTTITNKATRKVIDRTSDVTVSTVTIADTAVKSTLWTGPMAANSLAAGNVFKFHANGAVSNNGNHSDNDFTISIDVGGVEAVTLTPVTKAMSNVMWHIDANATQRTLGAPGTRAIHVHLMVGDADEVWAFGVANIDTTISMDVTVKIQWATAHINNTISLYQGFMEYKN